MLNFTSSALKNAGEVYLSQGQKVSLHVKESRKDLFEYDQDVNCPVNAHAMIDVTKPRKRL